MLRELHSVGDWIRYAASRFGAAELHFGHGFDSALDEASFLVLTTLDLPHDLPPAYVTARLLPSERRRVFERIRERADARVPLAYILGEAWFAGLSFKVTRDTLVPRSPIAELIEVGFEPWLPEPPARVLDLCTGSGCIAIATAVRFPQAEVVGSDLSEAALAVARENAVLHGVEGRTRWLNADGFEEMVGAVFDLIISNPPYVGVTEYEALPPEFGHEPRTGLVSGDDGLDLPLRILAQAADYLAEEGWLVLEVGASEQALLALLPDLPGEWASFERGGSGVLVVSAADLRSYAEPLSRVRRARES